VRVNYASLNPGGSVMMQFCPSMLRTKPCIPELDFSGEVVEVGASVPVARDLIRFFRPFLVTVANLSTAALP
jgi:NADPH:quinone reductase-like Zn-dependent oxidoreductase